MVGTCSSSIWHTQTTIASTVVAHMQKVAFTTVNPTNFLEVQEALEPFMQSSDFYPVTALGYGQGRYISYYTDSKFVILEFSNYVGCDPVMSVCFHPKIQTDGVVRAIKVLGIIGIRKLRLVPKLTLDAIRAVQNCKYRFVPDDADYLYATKILAEMVGPSLRRRRREVSWFQRSVVDLDIEIRSKINAREILEIQELMKNWQFARSENSEADIAPTNYFLEHHSVTKAQILIVRQQEKLIAFCVFEVLSNGMGVFHFVKAHPRVRGATSFVLRQVARKMRDRGVSVVNFAFDMGRLGLRGYKQSLQPVGMIQKAEVWF